MFESNWYSQVVGGAVRKVVSRNRRVSSRKGRASVDTLEKRQLLSSTVNFNNYTNSGNAYEGFYCSDLSLENSEQPDPGVQTVVVYGGPPGSANFSPVSGSLKLDTITMKDTNNTPGNMTVTGYDLGGNQVDSTSVSLNGSLQTYTFNWDRISYFAFSGLGCDIEQFTWDPASLPANQTITWGNIPTTLSYPPSQNVQLSATAPGGTVTFSLDGATTGTGSINPSNNVLSINSPGVYVIDGNQAGNYNYNSVSAQYTIDVGPLVTVSTNTLSLGSTNTGTAGTAASFNVSGIQLTSNLVVTAPTGVELSLNNSTWAGTETFTPTSGSVASTKVYARITSSAGVGGISGNITVASGANTQNIAVTGLVNAAGTTTVVSELGNTASTSDEAIGISGGNTYNIANQSFTTGTADLTLGSVTVQLDATTGSPNAPLAMGIYSNATGSAYYNSSSSAQSGVGIPGTLVATLTAPTGSFEPSAAGDYTYTSTSGLTLSANTTYWIVLSTTSSAANAYYNWQYDDNNDAPATQGGWSVSQTYTDGFYTSAGTSSPQLGWSIFPGTPQIFSIASKAVSPPSLSASSSVALGTTTYGTASAGQTFSVVGTNLTANVAVTAPTGVQISTDNSTWTSSLTLNPSGGGVNATLYARTSATATAGSINSNITVASAGVTTQDVAVTASINKATPTATLSVTNSPLTYTGSGLAASVGITTSSTPGSVTNVLTGGAATQRGVGVYSVTATFLPNDTTDYNTLTGLSAGSFSINKATPTFTLSVTNSPQTYDGSGQAATVGITTSSTPGSVSSILTGGAATQTTAGMYAVTATFVPDDTSDYNTVTGISVGNFTIGKATPTASLSVTNSPQTYNGTGQAAAVSVSSSSVSGSVSNILTGGLTSRTTAGIYAVTANFVPDDTTDYNTLTGLSAGSFEIDKATPTVTLAVTNSPQTYTGSGLAATVGVTTSSTSGTVTDILTGGAATQTAVGVYPVTATFLPDDTTDYNSVTGISAGNFQISEATLTVTNSPLPTLATAGTPIADKATVFGGLNPTGSVTFSLYNNSAGTGTALYTDTESLSADVSTSASTQLTTSGTYYWIETYNGDANNPGPVSSSAAAVNITAAAATSFTVSFPTSVLHGVQNTAVVTALDQYGNTVNDFTGTVALSSSDPLAAFSSTSYTYSASDQGVHSFGVTFNTPGSQTLTATKNSISGTDSNITVSKYSPAIGSTALPTTTTVGGSIADKATVTGGFNVSGSVTFNVYNNSTGTGTPLFTDTETTSGGTATSANYTPTTIGTLYWVDTFNGDTDNNSVSSAPAATPVTVNEAPSLVVTTTSDVVNPDDGVTSLREAIAYAGTLGAGTHAITFDPTVFATPQTITLSSMLGSLTPSDPAGTISITGPSAGVGISGNDAAIVFIIDSGTVALNNLTISHGYSDSSGSPDPSGGGIYNEGNLTIVDCTISNNSVGGGNFGGGIYNTRYGTLNITDSTISNNTTLDGGEGGGLYNQGTLIVSGSTFSNNSARTGGGLLDGSSNAAITNSTFYGNRAESGGGIFGDFSTLVDCTLTDNFAQLQGGGLYSDSTVVLGNTIVAGNTAGDAASADIFESIQSLGNNLIGNGDSTGGVTNGVNGDQVGTTANPIDPLLGTLGYYGGATETAPLLPGSPAIGAGNTTIGASTIEQITFSGNSDGSVQLGFEGNTITVDFPLYATDLGNLEGALDDLVSAVNASAYVDVQPGSALNQPYVYNVIFAGAFSDEAEPLFTVSDEQDMTATVTSLATGGTPATDQTRYTRSTTAPSIGAYENEGFTITASSNSATQSTHVNTAFATPLAFTVSSNNALLSNLSGGVVSFTAPSTGASASLGTNPVTLAADGTGSTSATANGVLGNYSVTATASGITNPAIFSLTNQGYSIRGIVYQDNNIDGALDTGDTYMAGVTINLNNGNTVITTSTAADGSFSFNNLVAGSYTLSETLPTGYVESAPASTTYTINATGSSDFANEDFGNYVPATTTQLSSTANPINYGQPVTFTATVTQQILNTDITTGTVTFTDGNTVLAANVPLNSSGQASYTDPLLAYGTQLITATFNPAPDSVFLTSSDMLSELVNLLRLTGTPSSNTNASYGGSGNTYLKAFDGNVNSYFDAPGASGNYIQLDLGSASTIVQIDYAPRYTEESRMVGGVFEASNDPTFSTGVVPLFTITTSPPDGINQQTINVTGTYRYVRYQSPSESYGNIAEMQVFGIPGATTTAPPAPNLVSSNTTESYYGEGNNYLKAFDGNPNTYFDAPTPDGNYVQLDLTAQTTILSITYAPRAQWESRMVGGVFEASNDPTFTTGVVPLFTITSAPDDGFTTQTINISGTYRYVRYVSPAGSYGNIAEMEVSTTLDTGGTGINNGGNGGSTGNATEVESANTTGSYDNAGNTFLNAFDGNVNTYFDAPTANGNWIQLDLGSAMTITKIVYAPRAQWEERMVGGYFEVSNDPTFATGVTTLFTITTVPVDGLTTMNISVAGTFRYVRYQSPAGSYGNIAEMQVVTSSNGNSLTAAPALGRVTLASATVSNTVQGSTEAAPVATAVASNLNTLLDSPIGSSNGTPLDLGSARTITQIDYTPSAGDATRMIGGFFEASNDASFISGVNLYTITSAPAAGITRQPISVPGRYRYVRFVALHGSTNIAAWQVFGL